MNCKAFHVRTTTFPVEAEAFTGIIITDSRLIDIAQVVKHSHQHPPEQDVIEGTVHDSPHRADAAGHSHTGNLLFVHESELDNEVAAPVSGDVSQAAEAVPYEETVPEPQPVAAEVPELVGEFLPLTKVLVT